MTRLRAASAYALALLFLSNVLNIADRTLLGIVVDPIKADLRLSDTEMSLVSGSAYVLFNLIVGLFIARWVDRGNRKLILTIGIALWSAATALTGVAQGFGSLAVARVLVGVGEATAFPVAISMLGDLYDSSRRPRAISIFQSSNIVGLVIGSVLAGVLAAALGWRAMFEICGLAGFVVVAILVLTLREPERISVEHHPDPGRDDLIGALKHLLRLRGFVALSLGTAFAAMAVSALPAWAPTFLLRSHGVSLAAVGALMGPAVGLSGITGTVVSGILATHLVRKHGSDAYSLLVPAIAVPLAAPFFAGFILAPSLVVAMNSAAVMNFLLSMSMGPCIAVGIGIAPERIRAVSSTVMLLATGIIGGALAPSIVGGVSDWLQPSQGTDSLRYGLAALAPTPLIAGVFLWASYARIRPRGQHVDP